MARHQDRSVVFLDGFVYRKNWVVMASHPVAAGPADLTRVFTYKDGEWLYYDLEMTARSIRILEKPAWAIYCLGRDGLVHIQTRNGPSEEQIPDAGTGPGKKYLGYVSMMREIGGALYACGVAGQIYRREKKGWVHFDQGVLDPQGPPKALDLYSIDGTSGEDIYAVGQRGLIWHYDGNTWGRQASPTKEDLNWLRCVSPEEVYLCGSSGGFFKGSKDGWKDFSVPGMDEDFWAVEVFQGKAYLAAKSRLFVFDGKKVKPVDTDLDPAPDGHHLHANDGVLWSFGLDRLAVYDGKKWSLVKHPDNP